MARNLLSRSMVGILVLGLGACASVFENSRYNETAAQMARISEADIINRAEFKVNMPQFLAAQLTDLDNRILQNLEEQKHDRVYGINKPLTAGSCSADIVESTLEATALLDSSGVASATLAEDKVTRAILATASISDARSLDFANADQSYDLGFADFENFRRIVTDAVNASSTVLNLHGVAGPSQDVNQEPPFVSLLVPPYEIITASPPAPLLAYVGAYYNGSFVDHFGNKFEKPAFKNGIEDGTIASFVQVFVELLADLVPPPLGAFVEGTKPDLTYHPKNVEPTYHKVFDKAYIVKQKGVDGISAKETKLIATGANFIADQGLTLFSGILEALSEIHVGFIVAGNFGVGSNDTLKTVARAAIETSLRRGAERGLRCLVERYDFDLVAEVIDNVSSATP